MMPEYIDYLSARTHEGGQFIVDTTGPISVDMTSTLIDFSTLYAGNGTFEFTRGDCFIILAAGYWIPERFTLYNYEDAGTLHDSFPKLNLRGHELVSGANIPLHQVGSNGFVRMPLPNSEVSLGVFTDPESEGIDENFSIQAFFPFQSGVDRPQVSMVNVPAALNGETVYVTPWIKVLHNFPLL